MAPSAADGPLLGYQQIEVDEPFTASGGWAPAPGNRIGHRLAGSGDWAGLGTTTLSVEFSHFPFAPPPWPVIGTFTISTADGTITGALNHVSVEPHLVLALTVTGGTGRFSEATRSLDLQGRLRSPIPAQTSTLEATVTGQLTMPGTTPTTRADSAKEVGATSSTTRASRSAAAGTAPLSSTASLEQLIHPSYSRSGDHHVRPRGEDCD